MTAACVHHFLENSALTNPQKTAVVCDAVRLSYQGLNARANRMARWLLQNGVLPGDRVVLMLPNGPEYVIAYYAILKTGAVAVPLSTDLKETGLRPLLQELEPRVLIGTARQGRLFASLRLTDYGVGAVILVGKPPSGFAATGFDAVVTDGEDANLGGHPQRSELASIIYTSGSTGRPKGVMLTHQNLVANTEAIVASLQLTSTDVQMVVLPFFYVMGKSLLNTHMAVGGTVIINNRFAFTAAVLNQMVEENVTGFSGVPATYAHLLHRSPLTEFRDRLESLRYCSQAGGHLSTALKRELKQALPDHTDIVVMYGATEASARLSYVEPWRFEEKIESIGRPIPGVRLSVLDDKGEELPTGQVGMIVASGANIMQGYWCDPLSTGKVLGAQGYRTGDLGYCDEDGYFYLVGRRDHLLKIGGHRVNPQEIEEVLMSLGLLTEVAVIGTEDPLLGHRLAAVAAPRDAGTKAQAILQLCHEHLPGYKVPGSVTLVKSLPKKPSGKVDRTACCTLLEP